MNEQLIDVHASATAPPERIWALLADPTTWADWGAWTESGPVPTGSPYRGVGTRRRLRARGVTSIEEITEFAAPHRFGYRLVAGLPLRDYAAVVALTRRPDGGTHIHWRSAWNGRISGLIFRHALTRFITDAVRRLARAAAV